MLDVYDWIGSPEIREHMRKCYPLSILEKTDIICGARRGFEEKEAALQTLLKEAEMRKERKHIGSLLQMYRLARRELREAGSGCIFALPVIHSWPGWPFTKVNCEACVYSSYEELLRGGEKIGNDPYLYVTKWIFMNGKWESAMEFDLQRVNGALSVTRFWVSREKERSWGITERMERLQEGEGFSPCGRNPYPIPFATGELVKLDVPTLNKPLFGVMYQEPDLNGTRYMFFGYVNGNCLDCLQLSYSKINFQGYRVIDCLHSARVDELPGGQKILGKISNHLIRLHRQDRTVADEEFYKLFGVDRKSKFRCMTDIPLSELISEERYI